VQANERRVADEGHVAMTCWGKGEHCNRQTCLLQQLAGGAKCCNKRMRDVLQMRNMLQRPVGERVSIATACWRSKVLQRVDEGRVADEGHVATTCWGKGEHCNRQAEGSVATVGGRGEGRVYCNSLLGCQVRVYSGKGSSQVRTKTDGGQGQRAGQEISLAGVGDRLDSTTKDNER